MKKLSFAFAFAFACYLAGSVVVMATPALSNDASASASAQQDDNQVERNQDSSTGIDYSHHCYYYDYSEHRDGASYPYILGNPYSDDHHYPHHYYPPQNCYGYGRW